MASTSSSATAASNGAAQTDDATAAFASDPNMHFDTQTKRWLYENPESGQEFEWNIAAKAWLPVMTDEEREAQQKAYSVAGVDESVSCARPCVSLRM